MSAISLISKASTAPPVQPRLGVIPEPVIRAIYGTVFLAQRNLSGQLAASSNKLRHWLHDRRLLLLNVPWPWQSQIFISTQIYPTQLSFCLTQPVAQQSLLFSFCGWFYNWRTFYIWKPPWTFAFIYPTCRSLNDSVCYKQSLCWCLSETHTFDMVSILSFQSIDTRVLAQFFFASLFRQHWHMHRCSFYLRTMSNNIGGVIIRKYSILTQWPCTVSLLGPQIYIVDSIISVILSHLMWWIDVDGCTFCQMQLVWRTLPWFYSVCLGATRTRCILTMGGKKWKTARHTKRYSR